MADDKAKVDCCGVINEDLVKRISENMPDDDLLYDMADLFRAFGDSTRVKIIYVLFESEMCVCDIATILNMNQSAISHQLRVLKDARLVKYRRDGKTIYYSLDDEHVKQLFDQAMAHLMHG